MKNKVIFFTIDRLGDYLIRSNVIYNISNNFKITEIITSEKNYKLIKTQNFFNKVIKFDTQKKFFNKIKFIFEFFFKKYDAAISFDGKNISSILLILLRANFKHIFIYKKKGFFNKKKLLFYIFILNSLNISFTVLKSRNLIELGNSEHYPSKYKILKKYFRNINDKTYFIQNLKCDDFLNYNNDYILIHLDEKICDIINVEKDMSKFLNVLSKQINRKIIITSFNNNFDYYKKIEIEKIKFDNINNFNLSDKKMFILEDLPLSNFYNLIKNSYINISCHAGFMVHASMLNNKKTIDIINESEKKWLNTWITKTDSYKTVYKSNLKKKFTLLEIFEKIKIIINET